MEHYEANLNEKVPSDGASVLVQRRTEWYATGQVPGPSERVSRWSIMNANLNEKGPSDGASVLSKWCTIPYATCYVPGPSGRVSLWSRCGIAVVSLWYRCGLAVVLL